MVILKNVVMTFFVISKHLIFILLPAIVFSQEYSPELIKKVEGFSHPESVVTSVDGKVLYISNIGDEKEGDGFISKTNTEGEVTELKWITGLTDPKGLLVVDDLLYVTDKTELVKMSISEGKIIEIISVEGSKSLNDVTIDNEGNIYISDTGKSSIFRMSKDSGEIKEWMNSEKLEHPNGVLAIDNNLMVSAWGAENPGHFKKVNLTSKEITNISETGIGNLDGVQLTENNNFLISDWQTGKIYLIKPNGDQKEILTSEKSSGDILYLQDQKKLILPMNLQNEVWFYSID